MLKLTRGVLVTLPARFYPDATTKPKGLKWEYQITPADGGLSFSQLAAHWPAAAEKL